MSYTALCKNAEEVKCTLRFTCKRFTAKPEKKKQEYLKGDYWNGECRFYIKNLTAEEENEEIIEQRNEFLHDNKLQ